MAAKKKVTKKSVSKARRIVLVRSNMSGVWMGVFVSRNGRDVTLTEARKIWRWRGANTTSELALVGCMKEYSRVAAPVNATVLDACEVIEATELAFSNVSACGWAP